MTCRTTPPLYDQPSFVRHLDAPASPGAGTRSRSAPCARRHPLPTRPPRPLRLFSTENLNWKTALESRIDAERRASSRTRPAARSRRSPGSTRTSATSTPSASSPTTTTPSGHQDGQELVLAVYHALATARTGQDPAARRLRRARRLLRSRPAPRGARRYPANSGATACAYRRWSSRRGPSRAPSQHGVRPHLDHQDDPAAFRPRRAQRARTAPQPARPGRRAPGTRTTSEHASRRPMTSGNC